MSNLKVKLGRVVATAAFMLVTTVVIGAVPASATVTTNCQFSGGVLTLGIDASTATTVSMDAAKNILVDGAFTNTLGGGCATAAAANTATTTTINVTGPAGVSNTNESLTIQTYQGTATANWGKINWTVNLGDQVAATAGDTFTVNNSGNTTAGVTTDWGATGVDLSGDGDVDVSLAGVETSMHILGVGQVYPAAGEVVNAGGSTATGAAYPTAITIDGTLNISDSTLTGGAGNDTITGGTGWDFLAGGLGNDSLDGGAGEDAVDYSASATGVVVTLGAPGVGSGEGLDSLTSIEDVAGSNHNDSLTGDGGDNWFYAGNGNDTITGGGNTAYGDTYDVAAAEALVTVDLGANTSTGGSGTDTLSGIENASGSEFADNLKGSSGNNIIWGEGGNDTLSGGAGNNDGADQFDGGSGIDVLDFGLNTLDTAVNLSAAPTANNCPDFDTSNPPNVADCGVGGAGNVDRFLTDTIENAILGSGNDTFTGSSFNNTVWPNGGQNALNGCPTVIVTTNCGIDTVNYSTGFEAGVTINLAGGGPSGGNADSIAFFSNAVGTPFNDTIIGTDANTGNSLKGGKGADDISGNSGPDFVLGGAGNDNIRGGAGDDTLKGGDANDTIRGAGGDDNIYGQKGKDKCNGGGGVNVVKCEKKLKGGQKVVAHARLARALGIKP
jgi:Ca2+-binding RTX toxin-like protein